MAFSGVHIACGFVGGLDVASQNQALLGDVVWSQTMASAGTTTRVAPPHLSSFDPSFEIAASLDVWVAIGAAPDASKVDADGDGSRLLVRAGETRNLFCKPGDRVAWVAA